MGKITAGGENWLTSDGSGDIIWIKKRSLQTPDYIHDSLKKRIDKKFNRMVG
jgi:hypothetical protein